MAKGYVTAEKADSITDFSSNPQVRRGTSANPFGGYGGFSVIHPHYRFRLKALFGNSSLQLIFPFQLCYT